MTRRKKRWRDLTTGQRRAVVLLGLVQFTLLGAALADLRRRDPADVNGPRWAWALASLVNFAGPICYFAFGRRRHGHQRGPR